MQVLVLEHIISQTRKGHQLSKMTVKKIYEEFRVISKQNKQGDQKLLDYLKNENGKKLKGSESGKIFKHRLSDGDRILYTYGSMLPYVREEEKNSLVLIAYAKHDDQGMIKSLPKDQRYQLIDDLLGVTDEILGQDLEAFGIDDYDAFAELVLENYSDKHTIYVIDPDSISEEMEDNEDWAFYLSPEQNQIIEDFKKHISPTLIMGGAGTGKTVLAVHLLNTFGEQNNGKCVYFTQSRELLNKVKKQYEVISQKTEYSNIYFYDINEFLIGVLKSNEIRVSREKFVQTTEFLEYLDSKPDYIHKIKRFGLTPMDVWTEVRGVIKGSLDDKWCRSSPICASKYDGKIIDELLSKELIRRLDTDKRKIMLAQSPNNVEVSKEAATVWKEMQEYFNRVNWEIEEISFDEYKSISEERTMIEKETRKLIYDLYRDYKKWLNLQGKFDENDLIRNVMQKGVSLTHYDYIIVDEVQDYTELQLRFIYELSNNKKGIVYAGDTHQIINPTVFSERRMINLHSDLSRKYLQKNFRCQSEVVKMGNSLAQIRRKKIAAGKHEIEENSVKTGLPVARLSYSESNVRELSEYLMQFPNTVILVADENEKNALISLIGKENYEKAGNNIIFSISEIKGMEYKYVFGYNLVSRYHDAWDEIINDEVSKKTRYRYYFNLLYVAITRAQTYLTLVENGECKLLDLLEKESPNEFHYRQVGVFDSEQLYLNKLTNNESDWVKFADNYFQAGKYEEAKQNYIKAGATNESIDKCDAEIALNKKDFNEAVRLFIKLKEKERVKMYMDEIPKDSYIYKLAMAMIDSKEIEMFDGDEFRKLIERVFGEASVEDLYKYFILEINNLIGNRLREMGME